jgi:pentatricopeptide repeat domain-containing protein 1
LDSLIERIIRASPDEVEGVLRASNFKLGPPAYTKIIKMCAKTSPPQGLVALEVYRLMRVVHGAEPNTITCSALINTLGKCKQCDKAFEVFDEMQEKGIEANIYTYSALLSACAKTKQFDRAMQVFEDLVNNHPEVEVDRITYSAAISACVQGRQVEKAFGIFHDMTKSGIKGNTITYNALLNGCEKCADGDKAVETFERMRAEKVPFDRTSFHSLIGALDRSRKISKALEYYRTMKTHGLYPDAATVSVVLAACANAKESTQALKVYNEARKQYNITPTPGMFNALISALYRGRRYDMVYEQLNSDMTGSALSVTTYCHLISACDRYKNWPKIFEIFQEYKKHSPMSVDVHVWARVFHACGRFQADEQVWVMMPGFESQARKMARETLRELWHEYKTKVQVFQSGRLRTEMATLAMSDESSVTEMAYKAPELEIRGDGTHKSAFDFTMEVTYVLKTAASAAARCSDPETAENILFTYDALYIRRDPSIYGALVSALALSGDRIAASCKMQEMYVMGIQPGVSTFGSLALAHALAGDANTALSIAEDAAHLVLPQQESDVSIMDAVIAACEAGGDWNRGAILFAHWAKIGLPGANYELHRAVAAANGRDPGPTPRVPYSVECSLPPYDVRVAHHFTETASIGAAKQYIQHSVGDRCGDMSSSAEDTESDIWNSLEEGVSTLSVTAVSFTPRSSTDSATAKNEILSSVNGTVVMNGDN